MQPITTQKPARSQSNSGAPSIIASDVRVKGNIETVGEIQLDGIVEGDVICGTLSMGEHGAVAGTISADSLVIRGKVEGEIRGKTVRLEKSCKVIGNVWHQTLSIEAGAYIKGKFAHAEDPRKGAKGESRVAPSGSGNVSRGDGLPAKEADKGTSPTRSVA
jgi:cytoskeletal protein CcmA (bactofilin family)